MNYHERPGSLWDAFDYSQTPLALQRSDCADNSIYFARDYPVVSATDDDVGVSLGLQ
jgi:hypothetical protein